MKKIKIFVTVSLLFILAFTIYSCSKKDDSPAYDESSTKTNPILQKFLNSSTYKRCKNVISAYGQIDKLAFNVDSIIIDGNTSFNYFTVNIKDGERVNATLDVVDLRDTEDLPYGDTYALNLNDMSNFDIESKTGKIILLDLNYDNFNHSIFTINNNIIEDRIYNKPKPEFLNKFNLSVIDKAKIAENSKRVTYGENSVPCDTNGNGNLGFYECYSCFKSASEIPGTFGSWWCDVPVAGWASCWSSMSAACAILASIY